MAKNTINAWHEIFARIFANLSVEQNVSPDWLINPETKRALKIDRLYPEIGMAIRFAGLRGTQQRGPVSIQEKAQQRSRDAARTELTEAHGISLATLDIAGGEPKDLFEALELAFSRAARRLRSDDRLPADEKSTRLEQLQAARIQARTFSREIKTDRDLALYVDLWRDRQFREAESQPAAAAPIPTDLPPLAEGMKLKHAHFGAGVIIGLSPNPDDSNNPFVQIRFDSAGERTFLANLLAGKISIV
jgi:hypothetical protein